MLRPGAQFKIVTIDLEPGEPLEKIQKMRDKYIARLPENQRATAKAGWTFLVAETPATGTQIARVAQAVGFSYMYIPERAEWAHPAALIFLASSGVGDPLRLRDRVPARDDARVDHARPARASPSSTVGFLNRCYHYDPDANSHAHAGMLALRLAAAARSILLMSALGLAMFLKQASPERSE